MLWFALGCLALTALYVGLTLMNLGLFRVPGPVSGHGQPIPVSLLIPARDEAARIEATLAAALASRDVALEVIVLDDGSSDDTATRVLQMASADPRLRLIHGAALPPGINGKQHACAQLAEAARHDTLLFMDADVTLSPDALVRSAGWLHRRRLGLASGFPQQPTNTWGETLLVPMIPVLLLGYLPIALARLMPRAPNLAAGCGQLMLVTRHAYADVGGHGAMATHMHDGLHLPANVRRAGHATDLFNAAGLARCRMYEGLASAWRGFSKDATEGMATPIGLPVWTLLLAGGHIGPFLAALAAWASAHQTALAASLVAITLLVTARVAVARATGQRALAVVLHPAATAVTLVLQWQALAAARRGRPRTWRGRTYTP